MSQEVSVSMKRSGPEIDLDFASMALGEMHIDNDALPVDERSGCARKLLGSAVLYCYIGTLDKALEARGVKYESITGRAKVKSGANEKEQTRILGITLDVTVRMNRSHAEVFERVRQVMRNGCVVSASLHAAFPVIYNLDPEYTVE